jgi:hypothetical protein
MTSLQLAPIRKRVYQQTTKSIEFQVEIIILVSFEAEFQEEIEFQRLNNELIRLERTISEFSTSCRRSMEKYPQSKTTLAIYFDLLVIKFLNN